LDSVTPYATRANYGLSRQRWHELRMVSPDLLDVSPSSGRQSRDGFVEGLRAGPSRAARSTGFRPPSSAGSGGGRGCALLRVEAVREAALGRGSARLDEQAVAAHGTRARKPRVRGIDDQWRLVGAGDRETRPLYPDGWGSGVGSQASSAITLAVRRRRGRSGPVDSTTWDVLRASRAALQGATPGALFDGYRGRQPPGAPAKAPASTWTPGHSRRR